MQQGVTLKKQNPLEQKRKKNTKKIYTNKQKARVIYSLGNISNYLCNKE